MPGSFYACLSSRQVSHFKAYYALSLPFSECVGSRFSHTAHKGSVEWEGKFGTSSLQICFAALCIWPWAKKELLVLPKNLVKAFSFWENTEKLAAK